MSAAEKWVDEQIPAAVPAALGEIAAAFANAHMEMHNPKFDSANPFFKSKFASLAAVRNAVIPLMAKHGICVAQDLVTAEGTISCSTILTHSSGQQMRFGPLTLPIAKADAQGYAAAGTYAKRISMQSVAGVVGDEDDDAESISQHNGKSQGHDPRGDLGKDVPQGEAFANAAAMRDILNADWEENIRALKVLDKHDVLNRDPDLYVAASGELTASERSAWKKYVTMAKTAQSLDKAASRR